MDSDQGKLFIGGISWETDEEKLKEYFQGYGDVLQVVVMRDKITGKPRGFGFVVFADPNVLDRVLQDRHTIDGRTVEAKRALSREEQQVSKVGYPGGGFARTFGGVGGGGVGNTRTKKIFVGGLPATLNEDGFRQYFETYGSVTDVVIMFDQQTNRPRGFGFISFDSEDSVDRVLHKTFHDLDGKQVEVKRALPKDANSGGGGRGGPGGYQGGYGSSLGNTGSYENTRMEPTNRYMQSQNAPGGYGYNAAPGGYGYPPSNNGMGYGVGYGAAGVGYGGGVPNAAPRASWGPMGPTGYGYGGGAASGQSPSGASGYGNQGYGGGYGGNDGGYGAVGGRTGGVGPTGGDGGGGYMGGGYGDGSGNTGYGGGYGARQGH